MSRYVHSCSHWLRPRSPPPPAFGLICEGLYWSAKIDDISLIPKNICHVEVGLCTYLDSHTVYTIRGFSTYFLFGVILARTALADLHNIFVQFYTTSMTNCRSPQYDNNKLHYARYIFLINIPKKNGHASVHCVYFTYTNAFRSIVLKPNS
jgi:hypothetical protein